jgi:hypothetical protein
MSNAQATLIEDDGAFLLSFADNTEESPWMVAADPHMQGLLNLVGPAQAYLADQRPDLYLSGELAVRFPRGDETVGQVAPDMLAAYAPRRLRSSFDVATEGSFRAFVLEIVSPASVRRRIGLLGPNVTLSSGPCTRCWTVRVVSALVPAFETRMKFIFC